MRKLRKMAIIVMDEISDLNYFLILFKKWLKLELNCFFRHFMWRLSRVNCKINRIIILKDVLIPFQKTH